MVTRAASSNSVKSVHPPPPRARVRVYLVFFFSVIVRAILFPRGGEKKSGRSEFLVEYIYPRKKRKEEEVVFRGRGFIRVT